MPGNLLKRLAGWFLIAGGFGMIATGAWFAVDHVRLLQRAERAPGDIVEIIGKRGAKGMTLYHPVVRFRTAQGVERRFTARPGLWPSPFDAGERVTVAYDADDPGRTVIVSFWTLWFLPLVMALFGGACFYAGRDTLKKIP